MTREGPFFGANRHSQTTLKIGSIARSFALQDRQGFGTMGNLSRVRESKEFSSEGPVRLSSWRLRTDVHRSVTVRNVQSAGTLSTASVTSDTLLLGLADPGNRTVWQQFVERYRPPILRFARRRGLTGDDAEDAAQQSLVAFAQAYQEGRYDREKGRLRSWLFGIARNQIRKTRRESHSRELPFDPEIQLEG
jgi:hypothetical protein